MSPRPACEHPFGANLCEKCRPLAYKEKNIIFHAEAEEAITLLREVLRDVLMDLPGDLDERIAALLKRIDNR